jgi:hypothetical protein
MSVSTPTITVQINASTPAELRQIMAQFYAEMGGAHMVDDMIVSDDETQAQVDVKPKTRKRYQTKPADDTPVDTPDDTPVDTPVVTGAVEEKTPTQARKEALEKVQMYFSANQGALPEIQKILAKYSVTQFADVADGKAHELLADVLLLVAGSPVAA